MDLFDVSHQVAANRSGPAVLDEITFLIPDPDATAQSANQDQPKPPNSTSRKLSRGFVQLDRAKLHGDLTLDDRNSASFSPLHLCALTICFASVVPLTRDRSQVRQNLDRVRIAPISGEIGYRNKA